jgi:hypothetical protein
MLCFRLFNESSPAAPLAEAVTQLREGHASKDLYAVEPASFQQIPNAPFAYWVSERIRRLFSELPRFEGDGRTVRQGLATADDFRFVRASWEVEALSSMKDNWPPFAKGGSYSLYYADVSLVVNWYASGKEIKHNFNEKGTLRSNVWMLGETERNNFFRPGITWPLRAFRFCPQAMPSGCVFSVRGYSAQSELSELPILFGLVSAQVFDALFKLMLGRMGYPEFIVGVLQTLPLPANIPKRSNEMLKSEVYRAWSRKRGKDTINLTSHAFHAPALVPGRKPQPTR